MKFYLPSFMDFRGRIYPQPHYLHYQGVDLARSLIEFYNGDYIDIKEDNISMKHIYQALSNTAGKNKLSLSKKEK